MKKSKKGTKKVAKKGTKKGATKTKSRSNEEEIVDVAEVEDDTVDAEANEEDDDVEAIEEAGEEDDDDVANDEDDHDEVVSDEDEVVETKHDETDAMDMRNISIRTLDKDGFFAIGNYGDFQVTMMMKADKSKNYHVGYINATSLCRLANKEFRKWKRLDMATQLINAVSIETCIDVGELLVLPNVEIKLRGTYVHPDLIPHIASWASPEFAIKVSKIINQYMVNKEIDRKDKEIAEKNKEIEGQKLVIKRKDMFIAKKQKENKSLTQKIDALSDALKKGNAKMSKMNENMKKLIAIDSDIRDEVVDISGKLACATDSRVVPTGYASDDNIIVILKNNSTPDDYADGETMYSYYCMRILKSVCNQSIKAYKVRFPKTVVLMRLGYSPNSINLFKRIKLALREKITSNKCSFNLNDRYTEKQMIRDIKKIHDERLATDDL
jgi:hypothetical protein